VLPNGQSQLTYNFLGGGTFHLVLEVHNTALETVDNGLALLGNSNARKILGFCFSLGLTSETERVHENDCNDIFRQLKLATLTDLT
jgi:hypothetical protein